MVANRKYRVIHRSETQRVDRASVLRYMAEDSEVYYFDARPVAGTQTMPKSWVKSIEERPITTKIDLNRKVG